jgi:hypothetical protein
MYDSLKNPTAKLVIMGFVVLLIVAAFQGLKKVDINYNTPTNLKTTKPTELTTQINIPTTQPIQTPNQYLDNEVMLFFSYVCPYCEEVYDFINTHNIENQLTIIYKEVSEDDGNLVELGVIALSCGIDANSVGIPFLYADGKCYVGAPEITNYFSGRISAVQ